MTKKIQCPFIIDASKPFQFKQVLDCGTGANCPHCGAEGRYVYIWFEFGVEKAAMSGCYKLLTGKVSKGDVEIFIESISFKQSRNKPINGWETTVLRMFDYISKNSLDTGKIGWANAKIAEAIGECKKFALSKRRGY